MLNTPMIDRETYRKIRKMSREEMQAFLVRYADGLLENKDERTIDLTALESDSIFAFQGVDNKRTL